MYEQYDLIIKVQIIWLKYKKCDMFLKKIVT